MKYKLYDGAKNDINGDLIYEVLANRNVNPDEYLHLKWSCILPYDKLDNMDKAVELFQKHYMKKEDELAILIDSDPDGYCSASMLYLYIRQLAPKYPIHILKHKIAKAHGLSTADGDDILIPKNVKLLIIPDAGTNDVDACAALAEKGIDILILDHHEKEIDNPYAVVVNNQTSKDYTNKNLCGSGVVYHFLQALDDAFWTEYANDYFDLVALATISDSMDIRSYENRGLINLGISNIHNNKCNKCLDAFIKSQSYCMNYRLNAHNIQWYITPLLNALIRIGTKEEKDLLFDAFIEKDSYFDYRKKGTKNNPSEIIQESIYDRAVRLCKNAKSRQDRQREKGVKAISEIVKDDNKNTYSKQNQEYENKVIMINVSEILDSGLTGVVAIKIAEKFHKPCILLKQYFNKELNKVVLRGSARNISHSPIENFKDVVNQTGIIEGRGHASAFGIVDLPLEDKDRALQSLNELLKDVEYDPTYRVDFILDINDIDESFVYKLSKMDGYICTGIEEPSVAVENICLNKNDFEILGKKEDTISFTYNNVKYIQFHCDEENELYQFLQDAWDDEDEISFNLVGRPSMNDYEGIITSQIIISDINVIQKRISE